MGNVITWKCERYVDLSMRTWSDGTVIFDEGTGDLHTLTPVASQVMALLMDCRTWTTAALTQKLLEEEPNSEDLAMMENMLTSLASIHLIGGTST